jgi:hypothetical protein
MEKLIRTLAVEVIRLTRVGEKLAPDHPQSVALRHSVRKLRTELDSHGIQFVDLTGQPYDPGLAVEILEAAGEVGPMQIVAMPRPIILWNGRLLMPGEAVLGPAPVTEAPQIDGVPLPPKAAWHAALRSKRNQRRAARRRNRNHEEKTL